MVNDEPPVAAATSAISTAEENQRNPKRSTVTLKDVAERANVSSTTASLFFNGRSEVCSESTAARLIEAAAELGYVTDNGRRRGRGNWRSPAIAPVSRDTRIVTPSSAGPRQDADIRQSFGPGGAYVFGVCIPHDALSPASTPTSPFRGYPNSFLEQVWRGISHIADVEDCRILQYPRRIRDGESIEPFLQEFRASGLIMSVRDDDPRPGLLAAAGLAVVLVERSTGVPEGCGAVFVLESDTVDRALSHLWQLGHRRIAHIAGPAMHYGDPVDEIGRRRRDSYTEWTHIRGVHEPALLASCNGWETMEQDVSAAVVQMLARQNPPTAIFCANDAIAIVACRAAMAIGVKIPDDLSIVGIDNSVFGAENEPSITSIEIPYEQVGVQSIVQLTRLLEGAPASACRMAIAVTNLVIRQSTGPAPGP